MPLFSPDHSPVCGPRLLRRLRTPADLYRTTLLDVRHAPGDWPLWLAKAKLDQAIITRRLAFEYYAFALQAALHGAGVAIGMHPCIVDDLAARRLVMPFKFSVLKKPGRLFTVRNEVKNQPVFVAFADRVREEARSELQTKHSR